MAVLLIEDDADLGKVLAQYLNLNNIDITLARNGTAAIELFNYSDFELAIIDVMLPDINGFELAKMLQGIKNDFSFLFLTAKNKNEDIIAGLKLGAVDYITKPFEPEELVLRINIALKRNNQEKIRDYTIGKFVLKPDELKLVTPGKNYVLTQKETDLLVFIIKNKNRLIKRDVLLKSVWGENDYFMGRSMDVFISRLRKYLLGDPSIQIETFRGVGYIFRDHTGL